VKIVELFSKINARFPQADTTPVTRSNLNYCFANLDEISRPALGDYQSLQVSQFSDLAARKIANLEISPLINVKAKDADKARVENLQALKFQIDDNNYVTISPTGANPLSLVLNGVDIFNSPVNFDYENNSGIFTSGKFSPTSIGGAPVMASLGRIVGSQLKLPDDSTIDLRKHITDKDDKGYTAVNAKTGSGDADNICHCSTLFSDFQLKDFSSRNEGKDFKIQFALDFEKDRTGFLKDLGPGDLVVTYNFFQKEDGNYGFRSEIDLKSKTDEPVYAGALGSHIYFNAEDGAKLKVPAKKRLEINDSEFVEPTGAMKDSEVDFEKGITLHDGYQFDDTLTGLSFKEDKFAHSELTKVNGDKVLFKQSATAPFIQVFNNKGGANELGRKYVCLEPMASSQDAINLSTRGRDNLNPVVVTKDSPYKIAYEIDALAA
jgi:galactose mutarotase-like enzyme